ncbi:PAS domain S-box protein [Paracraurococcus lichenis]|uniref:histidine kinase n=1 Tax=Paracraurococcus lichenis TaxID=3064888 RepID=A0ABT9E0K0_9PROT|nr:PAS domain S-box protein [Paracraurococcus sp. LOR1-02]MDO9709697.1 PAS domain S-box protein [Paracraurococcus sp. LOR1-02]
MTIEPGVDAGRRAAMAAPARVAAALRPVPTLRHRLLLFALAVALPLLALAGGAVWQQNRAERLRAEEALVARAHAMALLLDGEFAAAERVLRALAGSPALARGDLPTFWAEMRATSAAFGARAVNLIGPDTQILLSTSWRPGERLGVLPTGPAAEVLATGRSVVGNLFVSPSVGEWSVAVAVPLEAPLAPGGAPARHALGLVLPRERLLSTLTEQRLPPGAVASALDRQLTIVARTARDREMVAARPSEAVLAAMRQQAGIIPPHPTFEGVVMHAAYAVAPQSGFRVKVMVPEAAMEASLRQALLPTLLIGTLLLSASLACGALFANRLARSLRQLGEPGVEGIARGTAVREIDELGALLARRAEAREQAAAEARALFEASPVGVVRSDAGGRVTAANDAFLRIVGMTREDLAAGRVRWDDLTPPEWIGRDEAAIAEAVRHGACAPYQKEYVRPDGTRVPVLMFFAFHDRAVGAASAFVVDLSGWEATEAALARAHEQMRLAMQAARIFSWDWNVVTGAVQWSPGLEAALGMAEGTFGGTVESFRALVHPDDLPRVEAALHRALAEDAPYDIEFRMRRADGGERWVVARGTVQRDGTGRPTRMIGIDFDITDRKQAELALAESKAALRRITEAAHVATFEVTEPGGGGEARVSPGFRSLHGMPPGAHCDLPALLARIHPEDRAPVAAEQRRLAAEGGRYDTEYRVVLPDGSHRWLQSMGEGEPGPDGMPGRLRGVVIDVTARKLAELRARQALDEIRAVYATAPIGLGLVDRDYRHRSLNAALAAINGLPVEECIGRSLQELVPELWPELEPVFRAVLERGESFVDRPVSGRTPGVESGHWLVSYHPVRDEAGAVRGVSIAVRPVTREQHDTRALAESEARFRGTFEQASVGLAHVGLDGRWLRVNGRLCEILGYEEAELFGLSFQDLTHPEDLGADLAQVQALLDGSLRSYAMEKRYRRRDGSLVWANLTVSLSRDAAGRPEHFISVVEDISARKQAEAALAASEARLRDLLETLDLGAFMARDLDGTIRFWSGGCERLYGWPREEALGRSAHDLLRTEFPEPLAAIETALRRDGAWSGDLRHRTRSGEALVVAAQKALRRTPEGATVVMEALVDVTAQRRAEQALARANAELELRVAERTRALSEAAEELRAELRRREETHGALVQAQKLEALGQLTGSVAHDFNNILAAVMGSLRLIARRARDNREILDLAESGTRAADRATTLIRQLLAFARREELTPSVVRPADILAETDQMLRRSVGSGVTVSLRAAPETWPVLTDPHRLEVALLNLAVNARDAMDGSGSLQVVVRNAAAGGGEARPEGLHPATDYVVFAVRDSGPGMPPEVLARASEPFFTTKPRGQGTGLGLAMVHGFARQSGGALRLASAPGAGTLAEIWLPRAAREAAPVAAAAEPDPALHGAATILVVDDDDQVRLVTATLLRDFGYAVIEADSVASAMVQAMTAERLDLLVTDITMPGGRGPDLALRLRAAHPGVPVIFVSGYGDPGTLGSEIVLAKPFAPGELARLVLSALGRLPATPHERMLMRLSRPELRELYMTWRQAREAAGGEGMPRPEAIGIEARAGAAHAFLVAIEPGEGEPVFRFVQVGAALARRTGRPLPGEVAGDDLEGDEVFGGLGAAYRRCARLQVPCHDYARLHFGDGGAPVFFERLLLPLAADGGSEPTHLLGMAFFSDPA